MDEREPRTECYCNDSFDVRCTCWVNDLTFDNVEDQTTCTDAVVPPGSPAEKVRKKFRVQIDGQSYKGDQMVPFSLYKALVASEHNKQLTKKLKSKLHNNKQQLQLVD